MKYGSFDLTNEELEGTIIWEVEKRKYRRNISII